jgi:hypothetical protein
MGCDPDWNLAALDSSRLFITLGKQKKDYGSLFE